MTAGRLGDGALLHRSLGRQLPGQLGEPGLVGAYVPQRSGFGRLLLERAVPAELDGDVELDFAPGGLRCSIRIPLAEPIAWAG